MGVNILEFNNIMHLVVDDITIDSEASVATS